MLENGGMRRVEAGKCREKIETLRRKTKMLGRDWEQKGIPGNSRENMGNKKNS